jgi:thiamine biosynthesis protein ThiI
VGLKGRNRSAFERKLKENIESRLSVIGSARVSRISGRLLISLQNWPDTISAAEMVSRIPGVVRASCALRCAQDLERIYESSLWVMGQCEPYESFKVEARRANTDFPLDSMELNRLIGGWLSERLPEKLVRMNDPDVRLHAELIEGFAYLYAHTVKGMGGLPAGTSGRVISLLSAGLDSPVATWRMMKRGALVTALHFSGRPETSATSEHLVSEIVDVLKVYGGLERLCIAPFGAFQREISQSVPSDLRVVFYRRLMFAVANRLALDFGALALVTGESLGQVASQTLENIRAVDAVAEYPVLRPLIGTDKQEIIEAAKDIGTFEISSQKHEDCCTLFMPRHPATHAHLKTVERISESLPIDAWVQAIIDSLEVHGILFEA